jgi:hypothetical protein
MFWNYSKKSSQSGTLFLKVYIIQTDLACSFVMYFVMCVAGWSDLGYSVSMQTSCTVITICDICEYCLPFRWVWLLQGMHVLTNWSTSGKSYFEAGLRDHCLSAHCLGCKGCLVWNIWNPQVWPCVALVLQNHPGSSWTSKSLCQFCLERMHQSPKSPRIVTIVNQSYIIL